ncbi:MAG: sulfite exporter TauE/SafE family protein [Deltaproteobacteria bacterium]|nr:sulfite exporter TauE/SafE family protein [Deltaproteobacteria bacterium]
MGPEIILLAALFLMTAMVYSMAGLGGGSTYLALLVLFAFPFQLVPKVALVCNLLVVTGGFYHFYRAGHFSFKQVLPFVLTSIPMAFWGGSFVIGKTLFSILLGFSLFVAGCRLLWAGRSFTIQREIGLGHVLMVGLPTGALLGWLSGLVGIGGGIFLSPILLFLGWADSKRAAAAASFFILVNSLAGLMGQMVKDGSGFDLPIIGVLGLAVIAGGQLGSRMGAYAISKLTLQKISALLIMGISFRFLWEIF